MPIYAYECARCGAAFETLVRSSNTEAPACPACGAAEAKRLLSAPTIGGGVKAATQRARAAAAKEGHFSNYKSSELKGKL